MKTHNSNGVRLVPRALAVLNENDYALVVVTREGVNINLRSPDGVENLSIEEARAVAQAILQLAGEP